MRGKNTVYSKLKVRHERFSADLTVSSLSDLVEQGEYAQGL